ncbi:MAG: GNAT family N-acetyltransferase [Hormoscilla sp. GUM202]|nr:GNAT family N-acetyltransferase [Hormoscilla sp. GUM202]
MKVASPVPNGRVERRLSARPRPGAPHSSGHLSGSCRAVRRQGLGTFLLKELESEIASRNFQQIWVETATVLKEAVKLYESNGYQPAIGVETPRCDLVYVKYLAAHGQHL